MIISRDRIVEEARSWMGTAFHHQGRVKKTEKHKGGCDCIGLIIEVARALKIMGKDGRLLAEADVSGYGRLPDGQRLYRQLQQHLEEIPLRAVQPADVMLFCFDQNPQHVGLVSAYGEEGHFGLIHCYLQVRKVVEHRLDAVWQEKYVAAFRFPGIV